MHPVSVDAVYERRRSRLTTFFRIILAIPHIIFLYLWGIVAAIVTLIGWFAILITGRYPAGLWNLSASYLRYSTRVNGYLSLVVDPYPPFSGDGQYHIETRLERAASFSRWKALLRIFLILPAGFASYFVSGASQLISVFLWVKIVFTGTVPLGLHRFQVTSLRFSARLSAYALLLTDAYPSFEEPDEATATEAASVPAAQTGF